MSLPMLRVHRYTQVDLKERGARKWEILWFWETPQAAFDRYSLWVFNRANTTRAIFLASMTKA